MELVKAKFKQTEVGLIPIDWEVSTIEDVAKVVGGGTPSTTISDYWKGNIEWFTPTEISHVKYSSSSIRKISIEGFNNSSAQILPIGTILMTTRASIGDMSILLNEATTNQGFQSLIAKERIYNEFLYYLMLTKKGELLKNASGSTFLEISPKKVKAIYIPIPPNIHEQKAIATALSDVDDLIANLDKLITKKKAIKQGAMQQLLKGKIRLKGFESNSGYKQSELGLIPSDWDVKSLPEVFDYIHGKAHEQFIDKSGNYKVVNSKYVSSEGKVVKYSKQNFCPARQGDILTVLSDLPNGKALAKTFYVEKDNFHAVNQRVCIWRSKKDDSLFLNYVMNRHKYFLKFDDGVTQTHILNHHIEKCPVLVPRNINEQKAIGQCLREMQLELESLETKKAKYHNFKQGMMQELLTGKTRLI